MNENENLLQTKEFKLLFNLLEKAEQILSIINLSDSSISKYNTLKKLTFEQLNIDFKPLEKRYIKSHTSPPISTNQNNNNENIQNISNDSLYISYFINIKKSLIIDLMMNYISNLSNQQQDLNFYLNSLTEIYNLSPEIITKKTTKDIITDINIEETKMAEMFTKIDQVFVQNFENFENIKNNCEKNFKNDNYFSETTLNLIDENYERYKLNGENKNLNFNSIAYKDGKVDENILKLEFVKKVFDDYFKRNNNSFKNNDIINNNELFNDVCDSLPEIIKENDTFHKNFQDLMNYIANNIEGKII